jgi:hypothetical protein
VLQDYVWLPPDFVAQTLGFYSAPPAQQPPSLLAYPRQLFSAPAGALGESKRLVVQSPWSQLTSECQRFGHPPRLNN